MKIKYMLVFAVLATACFATEPVTEQKPVPAKDLSVSQELGKTGNEFLRFALEKAQKYSGKVEDAVGQGVDLAVKEAPETYRQFLVWRAWKHGLMFFLPCLFTIAFTTYSVVTAKKNDWDAGPNLMGVSCIISGILAFVAVITTISCADDLFAFVQIQVAPRIYLLEELTKLVHR